ncbi:MAG: hypothetical protein FJZ10_05250 [Candidatus Omnitrophica bacterium]|nr:hypothetical protein [Candidatus Omnitrophota bacterium]
MKKVIIIGGGFAGISALNRLRRFKNLADITLIDRKDEFNFLPMLPDIIGRGIHPELLAFKLDDYCKKVGIKFIKDEIAKIDLEKNIIFSRDNSFPYDYLIVASGSQTNFYGNEAAKKYSYKLDSTEDAANILEQLSENIFDAFIIAGGGYTGIEVATNLRRYLDRKKINKRIVIVERAPSILGLLPEWMKQYVNNNLKKLNIDILTNVTLDKIEIDKVFLSNKDELERAMLIWTAGVKTADFIFNLNKDKTPQGRIKVDEFLRITNNCFVVGDANTFSYKEKPLRMAVQFSIFQGELAAINIIKSINGSKLIAYKPIDLGYVIPMANNVSCGTILGINFRGLIATMLHYFMCIYRSRGFKNRLGVLKALLQ